jgi:hypothetical protein
VGKYFINDMLTQVDIFTRTLRARYLQLFGPVEIADAVLATMWIDLARDPGSHGDRFRRMSSLDPPPEFRDIGLPRPTVVRADLETMGVGFDVWFGSRACTGRTAA